jgi:nucleoside-diphosphate-sugar epimerase
MRVAVTGGSGRLGQPTIRELLAHGHEVVNLDLRASDIPGGEVIAVDLQRPADVLNGLRGCQAVVHLAAIPSPARALPADLFRVNMLSTWNVLDAAAQLQIRRLCLASSITAMGLGYTHKMRLDYLPVDEAHPCRPDEVYGVVKSLAEQMADAWARRDSGLSVASMRYSYAALAEEIPQWRAEREGGQDATHWRELWSIVVAEEAARANRLVIEGAITGHEVFFVVAAETTAAAPSRWLAERFFPGVPVRGDLAGRAALISAAKAKRLLGWRHSPLG